MTRCAMKAVLARFVSLPRLLIAATILVGLYQIGFAYFARSGVATCVAERAITREASVRASLAPGLGRRSDAACSSNVSNVDASLRRH